MMKVIAPLGVLLGVFLVLLAPLDLGATELGRAIEDAGHAPLFAAVAAGCWWWQRRFLKSISATRLFANAACVSFALGAFTECLQVISGWRDGSWMDLLRDAIGIVGALSYCACIDQRVELTQRIRRGYVSLSVVAIVLVIAPVAWSGIHYFVRWQQFPDLIRWTSRPAHHFLQPNEAQAELKADARMSEQGCSAALEVRPYPGATWPGIALVEAYPDWRSYTHLEWRAINPHAEKMFVSVRIHDRDHRGDFSDRYTERFGLAPGLNTFSIPLTRIEHAPATRQLDLGHIEQVIFFMNGGAEPRPFYLCSLRLTL